MKDQFLQKWKSELNSMSSCHIYVEFKQDLKLEKYLFYENPHYRRAIRNFRIKNTRIRKITGRYKGLERSQRFCITAMVALERSFMFLRLIWRNYIYLCIMSENSYVT